MALDALNKITIDVAAPGIMPVVHGVQEDIRSRFVEIELTENGQPLEIPAGTTGKVGLRRPNNTFVLYDEDEDGNAAVTISGNKATVYLRQEALAMPGRMYTNLILTSGTVTLTAFPFFVDIDAAAVPAGSVPQTYINILQQEYEFAAGVVAAAQDVLGDCQTEAGKAKTEADRAETYANGNQYPVSYHVQQSLTTSEKAQARTNISAASTSHASTHATGGSDPITPASIGAAAATALDDYIPETDKYAPDGVARTESGKVAPAQASAAYVPVFSSVTLSDSYAGKTLLADSGVSLGLGTATDGTEIEIWNTGSGTVTLNGSVFVAGEGNDDHAYILAYSVAVVKLMNSKWYVAGGVSL